MDFNYIFQKVYTIFWPLLFIKRIVFYVSNDLAHFFQRPADYS